jgi:hypothetical protein
MKIGFDLDKVFIDYPPFVPSMLIDKLYKKRDNGLLLYRIPSYPEQIFRKATHLPFLRPAIKENLSFLKNISKKGNKLYLISSRFKFLEEETQQVINKYQLDKIFDELYFNFENKQPHLFKNDVIKKLHLDLYVDDDFSLINYVAKHNPQTKFYWLSAKKTGMDLLPNISKITHLPDIFNKVENVKQSRLSPIKPGLGRGEEVRIKPKKSLLLNS